MRLKLIAVQGYKRFAMESRLDTRGPVIAIVGPNEAGKTSLLRAIEHLSSDDDTFDPSELTDRRPTRRPWLVGAHFSLDADDRKELGKLVPKDHELTYVVSRDADGDEEWEIRPEFPRDTRKRHRAGAALANAIEKGRFTELRDEGPLLRTRAASLAPELDTEAPWLDEEFRDELRNLATAIEAVVGDKTRKEVVRLIETLRIAAVAEEEPTKNELVHDVLADRLPRFLFFDSKNRVLKTEYVWQEHPTPPAALANLFKVADTNYSTFRTAAIQDDRATLDQMRERADAKLREAFQVWQQGKLHVSFSPNNHSLQLLIRDNDTTSRTLLADRSDGLRIFIALVAFAARYAGRVRPVLLIDEAETHLHYGAQADLVQVFERQTAAETIIYTTHSIGCLPNDLGASIRAVSPLDELYRSTIHNSFWARKEKVGLTPMMLAMGAEALAFTPSRRAVIGEGAGEAILLPSLIRESLPEEEQARPLGYQVAPGVSEVNPEDTADMEMEAANVAYLVDDDEGGRLHRRKLPERAKREGRVLVLGDGRHDGLGLEDLVEADVLAAAMNALVERRNIGDRVSAEKLPAVGRSTYLKRWCKRRGLDLDKVKADLAQEALNIGRERGQLVEPRRRALLRALHKKLVKVTSPPKD
jgi:predicted ATP-dependent endonuclease of OLD family